ncbi:hypothetical protein MKUB_12460 [Mycobacterium kubicae]|uniref:Uncharacterized protein n=1 Tax=Mycobacterium kubicae TaxID=120959 RepID=A0AAX1JFT9_9MYCO|nr:hypothetical protein [Mycobacterium kubicae]MCV7098585.1 hypothetical protein [Mycobacterium kubicae]QNI06013.1 hypothetical protein GAN17_06680 [Mycobacterium kubicae]QNI11005.1 hypothetical protein GAN18_07070 [Mycobacterium kubicae]QPI39218.1 hypothetical protein I2456_06955 [Mycobacterium kubicae]GFG63756.1 hypothetical protein MKUB_12460 [Mycobacterium kubicae]
MSAKTAQHDAAEALYRAIIETLDKHRHKGTLTEAVLDDLGRAYASISTCVPEQGRLG